MINEYQDTISSLDIFERIDELEELGDEGRSRNDDEELADLRSLSSEAEEYCSSWTDGTLMIADSYFESYIQELIEELHPEVDFTAFPFYCMDWAEAASEAQYDYTEVTMPNGHNFWIRQD